MDFQETSLNIIYKYDRVFIRNLGVISLKLLQGHDDKFWKEFS